MPIVFSLVTDVSLVWAECVIVAGGRVFASVNVFLLEICSCSGSHLPFVQVTSSM